jgi:hypothetical protein
MQNVVVAYAVSLLDAIVLIPDVQWAIGAYMIPAILHYVLG